MNDRQKSRVEEIDIIKLLQHIWTYRRKVLLWSIVGMIIGIILAFSIPKEYVSNVQLVPESKSKKQNDLGSMSSLSSLVGLNLPGNNVDGLNELVYPELVRSTPFLLEFTSIPVEFKDQKIIFYDYLTEKMRSPWWSHVLNAPFTFLKWIRSNKKETEIESINIFHPSEKQRLFIKELYSRTFVGFDKKTSVFHIGIRMQDPVIAAQIADSIVNKLNKYIISYRTQKTRADLSVMQRQLEEAQSIYRQADIAYNRAQDRNTNLISKSAYSQLTRLADERNLAFTVYQQAATQLEMTKVKLQEDTPIATIIEPASVPEKAASPKKLRIILFFAVLGGLLSISIIGIKKILHDQLKTPLIHR